MATRQLKVLTERGNHEIGNISSMRAQTLNHGAIVVDAPIDNFTAVELGFDAEGNRTCKQLSDITKKTYLIASPENRMMNEELVDFYNEVGEHARILHMYEGFRFDTSAFALNTGVTAIKNGQVAHWDVAKKKFLIQEAASPVTGYATANKKLLVVLDEDDLEYTAGKALVRLEVQ